MNPAIVSCCSKGYKAWVKGVFGAYEHILIYENIFRWET